MKEGLKKLKDARDEAFAELASYNDLPWSAEQKAAYERWVDAKCAYAYAIFQEYKNKPRCMP